MDDHFVPEGYRPLKSAIDQLAQARQTSIQSAQAEIRAALYGRSIMARAMERSTGRMFEIISDCWATKWALQWLESGVCQLPDQDGKVRITSERFDMFYRPESARIFVPENDLGRLIDAKPNAGARQSVRPVIPDAEAKRKFDEWRKSRGDNLPSAADDFAHMRQWGVSRDRVRALRQHAGVINRPPGSSRGKPK